MSDEMFYVRIWKVFAELSVLDIFKRFRILLEYARSERAEIRLILPTCRQKSVDPFFRKTLHTFKRERNTKRVKSVVFIQSSKERELCEEEEDRDGCLSLLASLRVHHPPVLVLPLFSPLVLIREETPSESFPERRNE